MLPVIHTEIVVIGGGPAGSSIAYRLASMGYQVLLIERERFPRPRVGESLPPGIMPVLEQLNVRQVIEKAGFLRPAHAEILWSSRMPQERRYSGEPGFQVDRGLFDQLLLENARRAGVKVLQPAHVIGIEHRSASSWWLKLEQAENNRFISARYLIDASGKKSLWKPHVQRVSASTLALHAYWQQKGGVGEASRVEAGKNAWYWAAPVPGRQLSVAVFIDSADLASAHGFNQGAHSQNAQSMSTLYQTLLAQTVLLRTCLGGERSSTVYCCNASAYVDKNVIGADFIKVGNAALCIDPLSSQGVQLAMMTALQASIVVHSQLSAPESASLAMDFYQTRIIERSEQHAQWAAQAYEDQDLFEHTHFWKKRYVPGTIAQAGMREYFVHPLKFTSNTRVKIHPGTRFVSVAGIQGNVIASIPALTHELLPRPIAYIQGVALYPLLALVSAGDTLAGVYEKMARCLSPSQLNAITNWLLNNGILIPAENTLD